MSVRERARARVEFVPLGKTKEVRDGVTIIAAANRADVPIGQSCNGDGICGERAACMARVSGDVAVTTGYW